MRGRCWGGDSLLLEGLIRFIPRTQLRGGLREDHADGHGDFRGHQDEKNQALPPEIAATGFIAQFIQRGKRLGRLRTRVVGVVDDEAARGDAMVPQDAPHTGPQEQGKRIWKGSLVIPGIHNSMIFRANKECPYKSSWIL